MSTRERSWPVTFLVCAVAVMVGVSVVWGEQPLVIPFVDVAVPSVVLLAFVPTVLALTFSVAGHRRLHLTGLKTTRRTGLRWYALSALLIPAVQLVAYLLAVGLGREYDRYTPLSTLAVIVPAVILAAGEEVGWTGYATAPLQRRWGPLGAALILSGVGVLIHVVPYVQADRDVTWIVGQIAVIVGLRIVMVWVFNRTAANVLPAVLLHATYNMGYILYPYQGSGYDPLMLGAVLWTFVTVVPLRWLILQRMVRFQN